MQPKVVDNDKDEITVSLNGKELRGWSYADDAERRQKMLQAREYVEGWCDATARLRSTIDLRSNNHLCEMKPGYHLTLPASYHFLNEGESIGPDISFPPEASSR